MFRGRLLPAGQVVAIVPGLASLTHLRRYAKMRMVGRSSREPPAARRPGRRAEGRG